MHLLSSTQPASEYKTNIRNVFKNKYLSVWLWKWKLDINLRKLEESRFWKDVLTEADDSQKWP